MGEFDRKLDPVRFTGGRRFELRESLPARALLAERIAKPGQSARMSWSPSDDEAKRRFRLRRSSEAQPQIADLIENAEVRRIDLISGLERPERGFPVLA